MKLDYSTILSVIVAMLIYAILDKLFLSQLLDKVGGNYDEGAYDEDFDSIAEKKKANQMYKSALKDAYDLASFDASYDEGAYDEDYDDEPSYEEAQQFDAEYDEHFKKNLRRGLNTTAAASRANNTMLKTYGSRYVAASNAAKVGGRGVRGRANTSAVTGNISAHGNIQGNTFDIQIKRETTTIAAALNVPIFAAMYKESLYNVLTSQFSGEARITGVALDSATGGLRFTFTLGVNSDTVLVTCNQVPYSVLLDASKFDRMKIGFVRYTLNNAANLGQFSELFGYASKSTFGRNSSDTVNVPSYKRPDQFQNGIVDVPFSFDVDKQSGLIVGMMAGQVQSIVLSMNAKSTKRIVA